MSSIFTIEYDWGEGGKRRGKDSKKIKIPRRGGIVKPHGLGVGECELTKIPGVQLYFHHEPTKRELADNGFRKTDLDNPKFTLKVGIVGHTAVHFLRGELLKKQVDLDTATSWTCQMTDQELELYDRVLNDDIICRRITEVIIERRRRFKIR